MEIIHLILGKANPDRMNGVNKVVHEMATNQVKRGYDAKVWGITANPVHDYPPRLFSTVLFRSYKNPFRVDRRLTNRLRSKKEPVVVHLHGAFLPCFYRVAMFLHRQGIPFIITPHSTYNKLMMRKNALLKNIYFQLFERRLLNRASAVHLLGQTEWEGLEEIYNNDKSVLIPYGFTSQPAAGKSPEKHKAFTIAYCGRLAVYPKGIDILIRGFARFHHLRPGSKLVIIGDGKERKSMEQLAATLKVEDAVLFTGSLYGTEKTNLLRQCHVFAHPSRTDGLPATIIEAAALGLPCIVSEATNTGDFISLYDAGHVMPALDEQHFCAGLEQIYSRIVLRGQQDLFKEHALRMIAGVFDWSVILARFATLYANAWKSRRSVYHQGLLHQQHKAII